MVGNEVLLILVDSGSTRSFMNSSMLSRLKCHVQTTKPVTVKLANNEELHGDQFVPNLSWWVQGETFHTPMIILPLGAYDAILGVDWLKKHGPIKGDWELKTIRVTNMGKRVTLQGVQQANSVTVRELPVEQLMKWTKGNEVWAMAVVHPEQAEQSAIVPPAIQSVLDNFSDVFAEPKTQKPCHPLDLMITQ
jgi:hypothetical protein